MQSRIESFRWRQLQFHTLRTTIDIFGEENLAPAELDSSVTRSVSQSVMFKMQWQGLNFIGLQWLNCKLVQAPCHSVEIKFRSLRGLSCSAWRNRKSEREREKKGFIFLLIGFDQKRSLSVRCVGEKRDCRQSNSCNSNESAAGSRKNQAWNASAQQKKKNRP